MILKDIKKFGAAYRQSENTRYNMISQEHQKKRCKIEEEERYEQFVQLTFEETDKAAI
jgi:hypothetical protein